MSGAGFRKDVTQIFRHRDFSALSASIDGEFEFISCEMDENIGILKVDMNAVFLINDGQHRKAAIEAAMKEDPSLEKETISIVFFTVAFFLPAYPARNGSRCHI